MTTLELKKHLEFWPKPMLFPSFEMQSNMLLLLLWMSGQRHGDMNGERTSLNTPPTWKASNRNLHQFGWQAWLYLLYLGCYSCDLHTQEKGANPVHCLSCGNPGDRPGGACTHMVSDRRVERTPVKLPSSHPTLEG